jgi:hypothetical protein
MLKNGNHLSAALPDGSCGNRQLALFAQDRQSTTRAALPKTPADAQKCTTPDFFPARSTLGARRHLGIGLARSKSLIPRAKTSSARTKTQKPALPSSLHLCPSASICGSSLALCIGVHLGVELGGCPQASIGGSSFRMCAPRSCGPSDPTPSASTESALPFLPTSLVWLQPPKQIEVACFAETETCRNPGLQVLL